MWILWFGSKLTKLPFRIEQRILENSPTPPNPAIIEIEMSHQLEIPLLLTKFPNVTMIYYYCDRNDLSESYIATLREAVTTLEVIIQDEDEWEIDDDDDYYDSYDSYDDYADNYDDDGRRYFVDDIYQ